jgi:hypothetical protein
MLGLDEHDKLTHSTHTNTIHQHAHLASHLHIFLQRFYRRSALLSASNASNASNATPAARPTAKQAPSLKPTVSAPNAAAACSWRA